MKSRRQFLTGVLSMGLLDFLGFKRRAVESEEIE